MQSQLSEVLIKFFNEKKRDYFTITELKDELSKPLSNILGVNIKKATQVVIRDSIDPYLTSEYSIKKVGRSIFLKKSPILDIDLNFARKYPKLTLNEIYSKLPLTQEEFANAINKYIKSGAIEISIIPQSKGLGVKIIPKDIKNITIPKDIKSKINEEEEIKKAYSEISHGRNHVKIFELRRYLKWPEKQFDMAIQKLWEEGVVDLQASSQNLLNNEEQRDSYRDKNNTLRILLLWRKG
jgi:hypothetical protein